jgi:hypothetical protein
MGNALLQGGGSKENIVMDGLRKRAVVNVRWLRRKSATSSSSFHVARVGYNCYWTLTLTIGITVQDPGRSNWVVSHILLHRLI